jgi:DNA repair exonuclease SbcCD nuclease subunit
MKILHCADIHLGRRPVGGVGDYSNKRYDDYFKAFSWAIDTAIAEQVRVVMIAGDLFDRKELMPEVLERTENLLSRLKDAHITVLLTEGNHDNITPGKEDDSWITYLANKGLLQRPTYTTDDKGFHFTPIDIDGYSFYGLGYPGSFVNETMQSLAAQLDSSPDTKNIIIVHTAIAADDFMPGTVEKETIKLFNGKALYIAGGHFHSYQAGAKDDSLFYRPGSLEYWDLAESGDKKGVIVFDTETRAHRFIASQPRKKTTITIEVKSDNYDDFKTEFAAIIDNATFDAGEELVFVVLEFQKPFYIDTAACEELVVKKGALKSFIKVQYQGDDSKDDTSSLISVEQVERDLIAGWELFSLKADETADILNSLKEYQKENNSDQFLETFDSMLEMVLNGNEAANEN